MRVSVNPGFFVASVFAHEALAALKKVPSIYSCFLVSCRARRNLTGLGGVTSILMVLDSAGYVTYIETKI
jgi:hypothetical protein